MSAALRLLAVTFILLANGCAAACACAPNTPRSSHSGPQTPPPTDAADVCADVAPEWSGTVMAALETTLGRVREVAATDHWGNLPDSATAILCYIDGSIPKAPPGGRSFDRVVVAIVDGRLEMLIAGYRSAIPIPSQ